jgi:choline dehydrogenase-like flavoprotein
MTSDQSLATSGSTVIHCVGYWRGNRADFDDWEAMGNKGWDYGTMATHRPST